MDEKKQIEEMAIIIEHACDDCNGDIDDCLKCPHKCHEYYGCGQEKTATKLYEARYRKIPEDAVVLTNEELVSRDEKIRNFCRSKTSKEVAKKILDNIPEQYRGFWFGALCKEYGIEVDNGRKTNL